MAYQNHANIFFGIHFTHVASAKSGPQLISIQQNGTNFIANWTEHQESLDVVIYL